MSLAAALAQGEDGFVLHQEQKIRNGFSLAQGDQILLQGPDFAIGAKPQVSDPEDSLGRIEAPRSKATRNLPIRRIVFYQGRSLTPPRRELRSLYIFLFHVKEALPRCIF